MCVGDKKYELAINLYDIVLDKYTPQDLKTGMYLAKAYFLKDNFEVCKKVLIKLISRNPHEMTLKFNLALCLFSQAQRIIYSDLRRSNQTRESMTYLRQSQRLFAWLQRNFENQYRFVKKASIMSEETRRKTLEQFTEMRETSESKNWLIEDLLARAEEELARDQEAEDERN